MSTFWILLEQMELFVIYILAGVILVKSRLFNRETLQPISKFVLRMGLPLLIFTNIINGVERNVLLSSGSVLMSAFLFYVAMFFISMGIARIFHIKGKTAQIYQTMSMFGNIGFMGIPIITSIYPENGILYVSVFSIVDQLFLWTLGVKLTAPEGEGKLVNASVHVNGDYEKTERNWDTVEVLIDEPVSSKEDALKLGIMPGDYVCFEPRTRVTSSGYIKSRFLDDKLSAAILLAYGKYLKDEKIEPQRAVYAHFTIYEEVGHGGSASVPDGVTEAWSVDMGCVGEGLMCTEREVSICAKDSGGPYNYEIVSRLVQLAKENNIGFAVDVYPHYGSDVETTLRAGNDIRHALIGPGVYASHGYERSHRDGAENTFRLIQAYIG